MHLNIPENELNHIINRFIGIKSWVNLRSVLMLHNRRRILRDDKSHLIDLASNIEHTCSIISPS